MHLQILSLLLSFVHQALVAVRDAMGQAFAELGGKLALPGVLALVVTSCAPPPSSSAPVSNQQFQGTAHSLSLSDVMDRVEAAVDQASPRDTRFTENENSRRAYVESYESGFRLGLNGTRRGATGQDEPRVQGWHAGQREGLRVFYEMYQLLYCSEDGGSK